MSSDSSRPIRLTRGMLGSWTIPGTDLSLLSNRDGHGWRFGMIRLTDDLEAWLTRHELADARFPRRKDLLRAYEAAAAIDPPPAESLPVPLRRITAGRYEMPGRDITVTRTDDGKTWNIIQGDTVLPPTAQTLDEARAIIRLYCLTWD